MPQVRKDVRQHQHSHVAAHAITLPGDFQQLSEHGCLRGRVAIIELQGVWPARKVRIAPVRQQDIAARASGPGIVLRRLSQIQFSAGDVILGVLLHPGVIQASVVGDKIEHQTQATLPQPLAQAGQAASPPSA